MFLGYSLKRKAYRFYNQRTKTIMESANVRVDEKFRIQERIVDYIKMMILLLNQGMMKYSLRLTMICRMKES